MSLFNLFGGPIRDWRALSLPQDDLAVLLHMEQSILWDRKRSELVKECAALLLSGNHDWVRPIRYLGYEQGRQAEHGAIAEAIKTLKETKE